MRIVVVSLTVYATVALLGAPSRFDSAQAATTYPWCMQPVGTWGPDCSYSTIGQCRASAAGVGFCYQNPAFEAAGQSRPQRMRR